MTQELTVAIVVAIVSAFGGLVVWTAQRFMERRDNERLRKEELYGTLLAATLEFSSDGNGAPFVFKSQHAWLYASDEILRAINEYNRAIVQYVSRGGDFEDEVSSRENWDPVVAAERSLRLAIRKDKPKTQIDQKWVLEEWQMITSHRQNIREYLSRER